MTELRTIFNYVKEHQWSNARQVGKNLSGGKSRANHFLYGYLGILFEKRGFTPPQWRVKSDDAYEKMIARLNPPSAPASMPSTPVFGSRQPGRQFDPSVRTPVNELPRFSICNSCELPIKPTGACGCS